jgi:hypothetical protein
MSEEMHPSAGSGRDPESQKNLLRKLINTMKEDNADAKQYRKASIDSLVGINNLVVDLLAGSQNESKKNDKDRKKEDSKRGDELEEKKERKGLFSKLAKLPSSLKDGVQKVKDAPGNLMGSLGKKVKGFSGMLGGLAKGAGVGILAIVAVAGLMSSGIIDAQKVKDSVLTLLSIGNEMDASKLATLVLFKPAMMAIGAGLAIFGAGSAIAGMSQALLEKFGQGNWAQNVVDNVTTLLSIKDNLGGNLNMLIDSAIFTAAMAGIGAGLAVFGVGSGLNVFMKGSDWATGIKESVITLMSIKDALGGNLNMLMDGGAFMLAMTGIGAGLAVFGAGSAVAGMSDAMTNFVNADWAQSIKDNVLTLLSIGSDLDKQGLSFLEEGGEFFLAMSGIAAGIGAFGIGGLIAKFASDDLGAKIKNNVVTLLSISDSIEGDIEVKSGKFKNAMTNIADGLKTFTAGNLASALGNVGVAVLNFLSGGDSKGPIQEMLSIADKEVELNKAASGIERMASALEKVSGINIGAGSIDIEGMLESFGHLPRLLSGLAHGNPDGTDGITFEGTGVFKDKKIDFGKGILDPNLKVPEISRVMTDVNSALGLGAPRNAQMSTAQGQNTELTGTGTGGTTVMDASTSVQNNTSTSSTAIYGDTTPAMDNYDGIAAARTRGNV